MDNLGKLAGALWIIWVKIRQLINILFCGYRRLEIGDCRSKNAAETYTRLGTGAPASDNMRRRERSSQIKAKGNLIAIISFVTFRDDISFVLFNESLNYLHDNVQCNLVPRVSPSVIWDPGYEVVCNARKLKYWNDYTHN